MRQTVYSLQDLVDRAVVREAMPAPVDRRLRRLAWTGMALLGGLAAYLGIASRLTLLSEPGRRPLVWVVGWGTLRATVQLHGHARTVFLSSLAILAAATVLAVATRGFRSAGVGAQLATFAVGVLGLGAAVPLAVAVAILVANAVILAALVLLAFAVGSALLLGLVSAAVDR